MVLSSQSRTASTRGWEVEGGEGEVEGGEGEGEVEGGEGEGEVEGGEGEVEGGTK